MIRTQVYVYKGFERFWHWTQALLILFLALTGFEIHGSLAFLGFEQAVRYHRVRRLRADGAHRVRHLLAPDHRRVAAVPADSQEPARAGGLLPGRASSGTRRIRHAGPCSAS